MRPSPKIGNSHLEQMNLIYEFICRFDVYNLLYAINGKKLDEDEIVSLTNDISEYNAKLSRQKTYLFKFCKKYPKEFARDENNTVESSVKVSWHMRSGTAGVKKLFKKFCKVSQKQLPAGVPEPQAHEISLISVKNYVLDLYGLSSYPDCVKDLFRVMFDFYVNMNECLEEGLRCIKEVDTTRGDAKKCLEILIKSCEKSREKQAHFIEAMMANPELKKAILNDKTLSGDAENPVLKAYKQSSGNMDKFAQKYYKNCLAKDVGKISLHAAISEVDADPVMSFAKVVFGDDEIKIRNINYIIERFDELLPDKCKRDKIPSLNLFFFYEWCQPIVGYESFLKYFDKYYLEHGGHWKPIGKSALSGACTKHTQSKDGSTDKIKQNLLTKIDSMLQKKFPSMEIAS